MLSAVAYWDGDTFTSIEYPGEPHLIGSNMIMFNNPDYSGSGEIRYINEYVDFFDEKGLSKTILNYNLDEQYTEKENAEVSYETLYEAYFVEDTEVSEETYKAQKESLVKQMENIEMYDLTLENIEKYVTE